MHKLFILIATIICACTSQTVLTGTGKAKLCWEKSLLPDAQYIVLQKPYGQPNAEWITLGTSDFAEFTIYKPTVRDVVYGVQTISGGDTSEIHSSLDSTACNNGECNETCSAGGGWYVHWKNDKVSGIRVVQASNK